ncbi:hypothetical protein MASR2M47_43550 [Draconibacterium sp.]
MAASSATDNCGTPIITAVAGEITGTCEKNQIFTVTATDGCNNMDIETVTYTWSDDAVAPSLTVPADRLALGCNPTTPPTVASVVAASSATDNCGTPVITAVAGEITGECEKTQIFTVTATHGCNNKDIETVTYTWSDDAVAPELTVPGAGLALGCNPTTLPTVASVEAASSATDNCGTPVITAVAGEITGECEKTQTFTVTATDGCNNKDIETVTYTWSDDSEDPSFTGCPAEVVTWTGIIPPTCTDALALVSVSDVCSANIIPTCDAGEIEIDGCERTQTFSLTATDGCNNTATCAVTFTWIVDDEEPVFNGCPSEPIALGCNPIAPECSDALALVTVTDGCSGTLTPTCSAGTITENGCQRSQIFTLTATDDQNNKTTCEVTYTWSDDAVAPELTVPGAGLALGCNPTTLPTVASVVAASSATDNCGTPVITAVAGEITGECEKTQIFTVTATDGCNNKDIETVIYTWTVDTEKPVITGLPEAPPAIVECSEVGNYPGIPNGGIGIVNLVVNGDFSNDDPNSLGFTSEYIYQPNIDGNTELWEEGEFSVGEDASEYHTNFFGIGSGGTGDNFMIVNGYAGEQQPVIWQQAISGLVVGQTYYLSAWAKSLNTVGNYANLKFSINDVQIGLPTGPLPDGPSGNDSPVSWTTFYAEWTATATSAVLKVVDLTTAASGNDFGLDNISFGPTPKVTAVDNCSGQLPVTYVETRTDGNCENNYTIERTWTATDNCENTTVITHSFAVVDETAPVFAPAPANATYVCITEVPAPGYLGWTDNCSGSGEVLGVDVSDGNTCPETITRTWSVVDECGNAASVSQTITVNDDVAPVITLPAEDLTMSCFDVNLVDAWIATASATDNCSGEVDIDPSYTLPDGYCDATITVTFTAVDACGNRATATKDFNIEYSGGITAPEDVIATVSCPDEATVPTPPEVRDACGRIASVELINDEIKLKWAIICEREVIYTFRYTACDGSTDDWTFTYNVVYEDVIMPANDGETILSADDLYTPTAPPIYDNCGHRLRFEEPTVSPIPEGEGTVTYTWAFLDCNSKVVYWTYTFTIEFDPNNGETYKLGNTRVFKNTVSMSDRRAIPITFNEDGEVQSISIYHNGGTGNVLLGVYSDQPGLPTTRLGVTATTALNSDEGWQVISLTSPLTVTSGQTVWLAWVAQNGIAVRYSVGTTKRALSPTRWATGMPETFGASSLDNYSYSVYCTYTPGAATPTLTVSPASVSLGSGSGSNGAFDITSNTAWSATDGADWLEVSPASGANNGAITVTATSANTGPTPRVATVTISGTGVTDRTITVEQENLPTTAVLGNTDLYASSASWSYRAAMPVTFSEAGSIQSITIYHNGGTGSVLLGVYSNAATAPAALRGVSAATAVDKTPGWQTVALTDPVPVTSGQTVWLSFVFQNNPGIRYMAGTPGRALSKATWSGGMPEAFGASSLENFKYSMYCTYTPGTATPTLTVSPASVSLGSGSDSNGAFDITSNTAWSATDGADWLEVSPASGANNGAITVTATSANTGPTPRVATVTISGTGVTDRTITVEQENLPTTAVLGNTDLYASSASWSYRAAMPVTFSEAGSIQSITIYHNGGTGSVLLGVYSNAATAPAALRGVSAATAVDKTPGWQTVALTDPVPVTSGQTVWLSFVFQNNPGIRYMAGTPGRALSKATWSGGMPEAFGASSLENFKYSMYCTYTPGTATPTLTVSPASVSLGSGSGSNGAFDITSNTAWSATDGADWLEVSPASGANNGAITVTATSANTGPTPRVATVTISGTGVTDRTITVEQENLPTTAVLGNTDLYASSASWSYRAAMPVTFSEAGSIQSITIYHNGGTGSVLLGVYSNAATAPAALRGVSAATAVDKTPGWQTVALTDPVPVTSGQTVWLSFVFQNNPGIRYMAGTPGRALSKATWSGGMPEAFGASSLENFKYSMYCTYTPIGTKAADIATDVDITTEFRVAELNVFPNPFSERLRFEFVSPESVNARIDLYDMTGRLVKTIFEQPVEGGASYEAEFRPETIISGMYIYRVIMGETVYNGKVVFKKE